MIEALDDDGYLHEDLDELLAHDPELVSRMLSDLAARFEDGFAWLHQ